MSWLSLRPGIDQPRPGRAFRADNGASVAVVNLGADLNLTFDSAEIARVLAAACTGAAEALDRLNAEDEPTAGMRGVINDAIEAWRDGETCDAIHPLAGEAQVQARAAWLYDPNVVKDLARVIARHLNAAQIREGAIGR